MNLIPRHITPPCDTDLVAYCPDISNNQYIICRYDECGFNVAGQHYVDKYVTHYFIAGEISE